MPDRQKTDRGKSQWGQKKGSRHVDNWRDRRDILIDKNILNALPDRGECGEMEKADDTLESTEMPKVRGGQTNTVFTEADMLIS